MKVLISGLVAILMAFPPLTVTVRAQQRAPLELPTQALDWLSLRYPNWRYAQISDEVRQAFEQRDVRLDLISGDFDGDARIDYACLVTQGTGDANDSGNTLVVFMGRQKNYEVYTIDDPAGEYLALSHKGEKAFNYELQKEFTFEHDAIDVCIFEKAATSYVYERGRFRAIITGD